MPFACGPCKSVRSFFNRNLKFLTLTCFSSAAAVSERCTNPANISVYVFKLDLFIDEISPKIENRK
jgi:hypothetical protein